jgi:hypothetical protein
MKTIEEKNAMIAEFMGFKLQDNPNERWFGQYFAEPNGTWGNRIEIMHFDTSWDWLMPVVDSIYNTGLDEQTATNEIGDVTHALLDVNIHATYEAVCNFIEMHNNLD